MSNKFTLKYIKDKKLRVKIRKGIKSLQNWNGNEDERKLKIFELYNDILPFAMEYSITRSADNE